MNIEEGSRQEPTAPVAPIELASTDGEITLKQYSSENAEEVLSDANIN